LQRHGASNGHHQGALGVVGGHVIDHLAVDSSNKQHQ
jgi:hypothetical protein